MCRHDARLDVQLLWIHRAANRSRTFARGSESTARDPEAQDNDAEGGCFKPVDHGAVIPFNLLDDAQNGFRPKRSAEQHIFSLDEALLAETASYTDPALRDADVLLPLVLRLKALGLITFRRARRGVIGVFTFLKSSICCG